MPREDAVQLPEQQTLSVAHGKPGMTQLRMSWQVEPTQIAEGPQHSGLLEQSKQPGSWQMPLVFRLQAGPAPRQQAPAIHGSPLGTHLVILHMPSTHPSPLQHGCRSSQAVPVPVQALPQMLLLLQVTPPQQGWVALHSPPTGMQAGPVGRQKPKLHA
jgi:hypothetical protein